LRLAAGAGPHPGPALATTYNRRRSDKQAIAEAHRKETELRSLTTLFRPTRIVDAHCDIPCGVYDPEQARIEAESCLRIIEKHDASDDKLFRARCIHVKEERAELVKHHLDVLWHDYFKPEHLENYPDLHETFWKATKQASKVKQSLDAGAAKELLTMIDTIDEMWKATGGPEKTRVNGRPS
jgi:nickel superoxide dismutase